MNLWENVLLALASLKANKMRAFLTMLGIIIGISSVITITTLGSIMSKSVTDTYDSLGATLIQIGLTQKNDSSRNYLNYEDFITSEMIEEFQKQFGDRIMSISLTDSAGNAKTLFRHEQLSINMNGVSPGSINGSMTKLLKGRYINDRDMQSFRQVCLISDKEAEKLYGKEDPIGKTLSITYENVTYDFTVVGIYEYSMTKLMSAMVNMTGDDWNADIYIPTSTCQLINYDGDMSAVGTYYYFSFMGAEGENVSKLADDASEFFNSRYYKSNDTYETMSYTAEQELSMFSEIIGIVSMVISIIAGISLLVGGIGVMNIMLVSVTERTREIGIRKALGATNGSIRMQFITESMIICLIGGLIGIILGLLLGNLAGIIIDTKAAPSISAIIIAVLFSTAIGVFFGFYPANKAAKYDPIEALRYE